MRYNNQWVFRNIHGYNILINTLDNSILSISPVLAEVFEELNNKENNLEMVLENWKRKNNISEDTNISSIMKYFKNKGVLIDE